jgi:inosine-uridine nucleoside N-ribohydrolase
VSQRNGSDHGRARPRVIIDCDPGHDDVFAIGLAATTCDVVAITAVAGNSPLTNTARNACIARDLFGLDVPVHAGAAGPLAGGEAGYAIAAHGRTGLDGPEPRTPTRGVDGDDAVSLLIETCRADEGLWLIATGPLTNVALALRAAPDLPGRVSGLSWMGGSVTHGNVTPVAEFNAWFDPEAASEVLAASWPELRMFGLNLTHQVLAGQASIDRLHTYDSDTSRFCAELLRFGNAFQAGVMGLPTERIHEAASPMHDPCAVLGVARPGLFTFHRRDVAVELTGEHTRGATVVDRRPWRRDGRIDVAHDVDATAALELIEAAVCV